jgi:peroxiredoxin
MRLVAGILAGALMLLGAGDYSNRRAPGFSLSDSHYQQHDPQDYRGKVLILDVMATPCGLCAKLVDNLVQVKAKYGDKIGIISLVTQPDNHDTADRFATAHKMTWPIVFDSGQVIMSYMKVTPANPQVHFPHVFLIDRDGYIRNDFEAADKGFETFDEMCAEIDKLLKGSK